MDKDSKMALVLLLQFTDREVFHDSPGFSEESVQQRAHARLRAEENLVTLKKSILTNGFLPVERMVVRPYGDGDPQKYLVVEGNRRTAAIQGADARPVPLTGAGSGLVVKTGAGIPGSANSC